MKYILFSILLLAISLNANIKKAYYSNGKVKNVGNYIQNKKDGEFKYYFKSGKIKKIRHYKNGIQFGKVTNYYETGEVESIIYIDDKGENTISCICYYKNKQIEEFYLFGDNELSLVKESFDKNGKRKEDLKIVDEEKKLYIYQRYYPNGTIQQKSAMKEDLLNGDSFQYYPNGNLRLSNHFINGKENGRVEIYSVDGKLITVYYKLDGKIVGSIRIIDGDIITIVDIKDGKITLIQSKKGKWIDKFYFKDNKCYKWTKFLYETIPYYNFVIKNDKIQSGEVSELKINAKPNKFNFKFNFKNLSKKEIKAFQLELTGVLSVSKKIL
jgi:antitoxin component YwqK of YwqJK toxin-antitoxin module